MSLVPESLGLAPFYAAQALALVAAVIEFFGYRQPDKHRLFTCLVISNLLVGTHFLLLDQPIAAVSVYLASVRFLVAQRWQARWLPWAFFSVPVGATLLLYRAPLDLLPVVAGFFLIFGTYKRNPMTVRQWFLIGNLLWLVYNLSVLAFVMAVVELGALAGNLRFFLRRGGGLAR